MVGAEEFGQVEKPDRECVSGQGRRPADGFCDLARHSWMRARLIRCDG